MSENKVKFVEGLRAFKPNEKAPDFIKASIVIDRNKLMTWLNQQKEEIKVDLKESKKGVYYFSVDEYVSKTNDSWKDEKFMKDAASTPEEVTNDLPF